MRSRTAGIDIAALCTIGFLGLVLAAGCAGCGGGSSSPSPTGSATPPPTQGGRQASLTSVNKTSGPSNTNLIIYGKNLYGPHFIGLLNDAEGHTWGSMVEYSAADDGSAVGFTVSKLNGTPDNVPYNIVVSVSGDGNSYQKATDPAGGPLTFTFVPTH